MHYALILLSPAGVCASVTDGAGGVDTDEEGVLIAVQFDADYVEEVAAGLALGPQALAGAGVEGDTTLGHGLLIGFGVHVAQHEHLPGVGILDDGGDEAVHLIEVWRICNPTTCRPTPLPLPMREGSGYL